MAVALLLLGAAGLVTGLTLLTWPLGVAAAGLLLLLAGIDLRR